MNRTFAPTIGYRTRSSRLAALRGLAPIVAFFVIAYAIAWGLWLDVAAAAAEVGVETYAFLRMGETQRFEVAPPLPSWLLYAITRVIDFAFSIAGVVVIATTAGAAGLRELGRRLIAWRFGVGWYLLALLPVGLYGLSTVMSGAAPVIGLGGALTALISLEACLLVSLFLRGAMGEELRRSPGTCVLGGSTATCSVQRSRGSPDVASASWGLGNYGSWLERPARSARP